MPAWIYVLAAAAVAFVAWFAFARRWAHALWYSWTRARHLADLTQAEVIPGAEYLPYAPVSGAPPWPVACAVDHGGAPCPGYPDWREQTAAELAPEALDLLAAPPDDPGPGGALASSSPPPGPDQAAITVMAPGKSLRRAWVADEQAAVVAPSRLADTGEIRDAHLLAEVAAELRAQDDDARAYCSALERDRQTYMHQLREVFA